MKICVIPGSFDPITKGHVDIIQRASLLFDRVVVAVLKNFDKNSCFSTEKRLGYIRKSVAGFGNVEAMAFDGLTVDFARKIGACCIVRGIRTVADFEYELKIAAVNRQLAPEIESVMLMTSQEYSHISSSIVREVGLMGGDISGFIPQEILPEVTCELLAKKN